LNIHENYQRVLAAIAEACIKAERLPEEVQLIAVSKTHPVTAVEELAGFGQKDFAENRIAELVDKKNGARISGLSWHLIGQLQTNKVKLLTADMLLHSLDRVSLVEKLEQRFSIAGEKIRALIQVNCSNEANKSGVALNEFDALVDAVRASSAIEVLGLMTMAENTTSEKTIRSAFATLRGLSEKLKAAAIFPGYQGFLSMGMSGDFRWAIAEGATHVRIGSAIFGHR
jgi:pyridoxal phosphate enzyme (YggS family)